jgi:hypothetical protein
MSRPYEEINVNNPAPMATLNPAPLTTLRPGKATQVEFSAGPLGPDAGNISNFNENWRLYVMGWVDYTDASNIKRRTTFCREWRRPRGPEGGMSDPRFFPVENEPDYEHEE